MVAIPVLVVLPQNSDLRESADAAATAMATGQPTTTGTSPEAAGQLPDSIILDTSFAAVPMGLGAPTPESFQATAAHEDSEFLVRGVIDSEDLPRFAEYVKGQPKVFVDAQIGAMPICAGDPALGSAADVRSLLNVSELTRRGLTGDGVAIAIVDSGINLSHLQKRGVPARLDPHIFWTPTPNVPPGEYPVDHGTMCAYCALISAPNATLLDFPLLKSTRRGGSAMDGVLSDAITAFNVMLNMMLKPEDERPYQSLIVNNSWGMFHQSWDFPVGHPGRYADNPNHPFNLIVGSLAQAGADILFAAGNCGSDCPDGRCQDVSTDVITGANSHPDVLSLAGVDTSRTRVGYSSQGPGNANLHGLKPDVAAYTHFNGSNAYGVGSADGGTSTACPVAAGCMASLRTRTPPSQLPPGALADVVRDTAVKPNGSTGHDNDIGFGIINPIGVADRLVPIV
jgi:hypothetical protein